MLCFPIFCLALDRLADFQKHFEFKNNVPSLRPSSLRFLFRFPGELEYEWNQCQNLQWPLDANNIDYCVEELRLPAVKYDRSKLRSLPKEHYLLIFTRSSLLYHRTVHNHSFSMKLKQQPSTSSIIWGCDHLNSHEELVNSLSKFTTTTRKLTITNWSGTTLENVREYSI